ncbi:DoxX family protein [Oharaeibacter diazotrophicus]|uniref:Putative oxidoreductase n=1 Tax=Oharaeibacter diazotrophicus TaxID=1920512 RepID=A0A4R6RBM3_9HYPH|nr:DoxX family protein [Oharaeibacter diazotrophicus]TDP83472.1 putative oxidoreductase [Oharaeibacter diazotrophicus]BBE72305.1 inner membrane protein YqjF [Pleomorphomonas sp. SM30]GLS79075.1 membrane protein [Oharaeibacter diazotrophicus]
MTALKAPALLVGRILLAYIFIVAGWGKIGGYEGTAGYMAAMGVPGGLLPLVILTELGGGIAILVGFQTRLVAILLAGFCVISGYLFHFLAITGADAMADMTNGIMWMKNLAIAGGFLSLFAAGPGAWSVDAVKPVGPLATA